MVPPPPPTPPKPTAFGVQLKTTGIPSRPTDHSIQAQVETELIGSVKDRLKQFDLKAGQQQQIRPRSKSSDRRPIRPAKPTGILSDPRPQQLAKNLGQVDSAKGPASSTPLVHQTRSLFETTGNRCDFSEIPRSTQTTSRSSFNLKDIRAKLENEIHLGPVEPKTAHHVTIEPGHQRHTEPQRKTSGPARPPPPKVQQSPVSFACFSMIP